MNELEFYESLLNLPDLKITSIDKSSTKYIFHCQYTKSSSNCPICLGATGKVNQTDVRKIRDLKISECEVWLHVKVPQFHCPACNRYFFDNPDWAVSGKSYTKRQEKWIFEMCEKQAFTQVAQLADMCHRTVERLFYSHARKRVNLPERYAKVRKMGIDEIAHRKGKKDYACVLTDLERGIHLDILPNRRKETLIAHFQSLGEDFCNQIEVVSCDIWRAYISVSKECFPNCQVVIDRFHVVKPLNDVLDSLRRQLRREHQEDDSFKHLKWILFKRPEKCSQEERCLLHKAFGSSWLLEEAYELRNSFNAMFDIATNQQELLKSMHCWVRHAKQLDYAPLNKFVKTLQHWKGPIAAFANEHISNAVTEGLNNFLRYFKRISFGLPNFENMRLRVLVASA